MTDYKLLNIATGKIFEERGWTLSDPDYGKPSLIRTIYEEKRLCNPLKRTDFYKYSCWLPVRRFLEGSSPTVTYRSKKLSALLGTENLYISFSGYWPEIGANMTTCTFKETEAYSVCGRLDIDNKKVMVVASAGNTARSFAKVCSDNKIPLLIVIPRGNLDAMWFPTPPDECVKLVCTPEGSDYYDAIDLAAKICSSPLFFEEGGAKNVARRDGMGTTLLSAVSEIGEIPHYYFQAIGSGTGTIAAWEANLRLIEDGRFGTRKMKLIPSQNIPFTPMYDAWKADSRELLPFNPEDAREKALEIISKVLSNRKPPYSVPGGLFDALKDSGGDMEIVTNEECSRACTMFEESEGIDIHPAAGVALASLINCLKSGKVEREKIIMLNITGGGEKRFIKENKIVMLQPRLIIDNNLDKSTISRTAELLFD
ncbi:MAG: cysteate synthase [Bacteroidales bacterium]|nr:cysteate synthase [Bacteroidales bacterium]MDD2424472.1 cysteate synthase [Bacteroidales bacterium]MDD3988546.1 cysteate synthase [Bacteroidales bacterium]